MSGRSRKQLSAHAMRKRQKGGNLAPAGTHYDVDLRAPSGTTPAESRLHRLYMEVYFSTAEDSPMNVRIGGVPVRKHMSKSQILSELIALMSELDLASVPRGMKNMHMVESIKNLLENPDSVENGDETKCSQLIEAVTNMRDNERLEIGALDGEFIFTKKEGTEEI